MSRAVFSRHSGTVAETRVRRGDKVNEGDILIVLNNSFPSLEQSKQLTIRSPIAGTILTSDIARGLLHRPVRPGEVLLVIQPATQSSDGVE